MNYLHRLLLATISVAFFIGAAQAQNAGTTTQHAFAIGKGAGVTGYTSLLCGSAQLAVGQAAADPICQTITGDVTISAGGVTAIGANKVTNAQIRQSAALSLVGNATNAGANVADILATPGSSCVFMENASTLTCANIATANIVNGAVTNAKLATMADGTIKSNLSGGPATPSDNTITAVLDKLFGTTQGSVIYRNATQWVALAPGTAGQFLTTQGAAANPNWSSGGAGTGTITEYKQTAGFGITQSGNCDVTTSNAGSPCNHAVNLSTFTNSIGADVALNNSTYTTGPTTAQGTSGTWFASGTVTILDTTAATNGDCKLWDGTTVIDSGRSNWSSTQHNTVTLSGVIASPAANIRIDCRSLTNTSLMRFNVTGNSKDSTLTVVRIQ